MRFHSSGRARITRFEVHPRQQPRLTPFDSVWHNPSEPIWPACRPAIEARFDGRCPERQRRRGANRHRPIRIRSKRSSAGSKRSWEDHPPQWTFELREIYPCARPAEEAVGTVLAFFHRPPARSGRPANGADSRRLIRLALAPTVVLRRFSSLSPGPCRRGEQPHR